MQPPLLSVDRLSVGFPAPDGWLPAVRDLSFDLERGEILGLVGESGCGKSVTARSIVGLPPVPGRILAGRIRLAGRDLTGDRAATRAARGRRVGLIFQDPAGALDPVFSLGAQLSETLRARLRLSRAAARRKAAALLARVALPDPERALRAFSHELSGGQRQRALIALALAGEPDLLIADEPTTALDVTIQAQILELLARLRRELDLAVLFITHDLAVVAELCDRVVVMYAGEAVESGPVDAVFAQPHHPYTRALLGAMPRLGEPARPVEGLQGEVPPVGRLPRGCVFHPRCPEALARCQSRRPLPAEVGESRLASCLLLAPGSTTETAGD